MHARKIVKNLFQLFKLAAYQVNDKKKLKQVTAVSFTSTRGNKMISNILILIVFLYLAIRLLMLIVLIMRRLNRSRNLTQIESSI